MSVKLTALVTEGGKRQHFIADFGVWSLAGILQANYPRLSPEGAQALAQLAALGGKGELSGVSIVGAAFDGARALCPHCAWETPLRRVQSREDFSEYVRQDRNSGFIDPRDVGKFQRGVPMYFSPGACDLCGENLTKENIVQEGEQA